MLYASAAYTVMRCPSVCLSVCLSRSCILSKWINIFTKFLHRWVATILVVPYQTSRWYSDGTSPPTASNPGGVGRNRDSDPVAGFIACCKRCDRLGVINMVPPDGGKLWHLSLVVSGGVCWYDEMFMTRSFNVTPKTTKQHLTAHSDLICSVCN